MVKYLYLLLLILIIVYELLRKKKEKIDYLTMFNIYFSVYYCIPPIVSNFFEGYISRYYSFIGNTNGTYYGFLLSAIAYCFVLLGYNKKIVFNKKKTISKEKKREIKNENNFFWILSLILLIIGIFAFLIYASMYGGISSLIYNSALIRDNIFEMKDDYSAIQFISRFIVCLQLASYIIFGLWCKKKCGTTMMCVSMFLSLLYLIVHAGRAAILTFIFVIIFSRISIKKTKVKPFQWIFMVVIVILALLYLRPLLVNLSYMPQGFNVFWYHFMKTISASSAAEGLKQALFRVCNYFEHKFVSNEIAIKAINYGQYKYNFFIDIISASVAIIPSFLLPFAKPDSIATDNTLLIRGTTVGGVIPPGGVAFGYYACGILGVIIFSLIVGIVGRKMTKFFESYDSTVMTVLKTFGMFVWVDLFINGELRQWILRYFIYWIIVYIIKKFSIREDIKEENESHFNEENF